MDMGRRFAPIIMKTIRFHGFDHTANWVAKVRNVSRLGSHKKPLHEIWGLRGTPVQHSNCHGNY